MLLRGGPMSPKSQVCTGGSSPKCRRYSCSARWQLTLYFASSWASGLWCSLCGKQAGSAGPPEAFFSSGTYSTQEAVVRVARTVRAPGTCQHKGCGKAEDADADVAFADELQAGGFASY